MQKWAREHRKVCVLFWENQWFHGLGMTWVMNVSDRTFELIGWHFKPLCAWNTSPARVSWAPGRRTEAILRPSKGPASQTDLDLTSVLLGKISVLCVWAKNELVSIEKCKLSQSKTNHEVWICPIRHFDLIGWHFKPLCAWNTSPARVLWAPRLATDDEEAVTVVA